MSGGNLQFNEDLKCELVAKLEEVLRRVKTGHVHVYKESIDYAPILNAHGETTSWTPLNYKVHFGFKDEVTNKGVQITIDTDIRKDDKND